MARNIFIAGVITFILMAAVTYLELKSDYVFYHLWWWDNVMHALGGIWAGLIAAWFVVVRRQLPSLTQVVGFALACGVAIEILEFYSGLGRSIFMPYGLDTMKDIFMDLIGGYMAWHIALFFKQA